MKYRKVKYLIFLKFVVNIINMMLQYLGKYVFIWWLLFMHANIILDKVSEHHKRYLPPDYKV